MASWLGLTKSFLTVVRDPERTDAIFRVISDPRVTNAESYQIARRKLFSSEATRALIDSRYRANWDLDELLKLPQNSLGFVYAKFMKDLSLRVDYYEKVPGESEHVYVQMRSRQTHDLWHVITGFDTSLVGEIGLQAFALAQISSRASVMIIAMFMLHISFFRPDLLLDVFDAIAQGWQMGLTSRPLFAEKFEENWSRDLSEYRSFLGVKPWTARAAV